MVVSSVHCGVFDTSIIAPPPPPPYATAIHAGFGAIRAEKSPRGGRNSLGAWHFGGDSLGERFTRLLPRAGPSSYNLSVSADALPPPLPRGGFGSPCKVNGFARGSPTRGAVERSETERLY